jgi:hypothetical protein
MKVDKELLQDQVKFLYSYDWREKDIPQEVIGVLNLLEDILEGEGK